MADTIFKDKTLLITGGTGSFGNTVLKHFLTTDIGEIRIFSRDEKKQDDMRHELQAKYPAYAEKVKFYIGDVRNPQSLRDVMPGVNFIFHAAALKQVPSCEFFPMEAVRTNIEGTDNMLHAAIEAGVPKAWGGVRPPQPAMCVHDGDGVRPSDGMPYGEECKGCWVFTASSKDAPFVVDAQVQKIIDPTQVYSGMWGNVNVAFFAYNSNGKKGIGCALNGVQKVRDGEPLSGRVTAEEAFPPVGPAVDPFAVPF